MGKILGLLILACFLVACGERTATRPAARSAPASAARPVPSDTAAVATSIPADDDGCAADTTQAHAAPRALMDEYLERDGWGEFTEASDWYAQAVECPGHTPGWDESVLVTTWTVQPLREGADTATYVVTFQRVGRLTQDSAGLFIASEPGVEADTVPVVRTPYGWRVGGFARPPHVLPIGARARFRLRAHDRALLDSLSTADARPSRSGV